MVIQLNKSTSTITLLNSRKTIVLKQTGRRGLKGEQGTPGIPGVGIPTGGTAKQALIKTSSLDYAVAFEDVVNSINGETGDIELPVVTDATSFVKGIIQLAGDLGGYGSSAASPVLTNVAKVYNVKDGVIIDGSLVRAVGDGATDDAPALQLIMDYISDQGGGIMWCPRATYMVRSSVYIRDGVTVDGVSGSTIFTSDIDPKIQRDNGVPDNERMYGIFRSDQTHAINKGWTCRNVKFLGNVTEEPSVPQADRTRDPSPFHAIKVNGSYAPETDDDFGQPTSGPYITNIVIENIEVQNMASLPITIFGVSGRNITNGCLFRNCKDAGWVYNHEVICTNNHSINSNDNGFSLSRGNEKVICVGNTVENAALFGIWLSGYNEDIGPTQFTCVGNVIKGTGRSCINLDFGPSKGIISGNYLYQGYHRGPFDAVSDSGTDGITITGASGGVHAANLLIDGNIIEAAARNGISFKECDNVLICNNLIINPGTQYKADGVTEILAGDLTNNNGICPVAAGSYSRALVKDNYLVETRVTPYSNWPISRSNTSGLTCRRNDWSGGWRNVDNTMVISDRVPAGNPIVFQFGGGNGTDGGDISVDARMNFAGSGNLRLRSADGSVLTVETTSTSSAAKTSFLMMANNALIGAITTARLDAASSSIMAFRPLRNAMLASDGTSAPFWIKGLALNSRAVLGLMGGQAVQRTTVADASYTALAIDYIVAYTSLSVGRTVSLKDASTLDSGQTYIIKDETGSASTKNITITPLAGTINGAASVVINLDNGSVLVYSDGVNWHTGPGLYNSSQLSGSPSGAAGGDLAGTYPNPTIATLTNDVTLADGVDLALNATTGTKIGTGTTQKLGFFNATPVVQQTATTDLGTALANLGFRASGATYTLSTSGTGVFTGVHSLTGNQRALGVSRTGAVTLSTVSATNNECDATTAPFTITLPATSGNAGMIFEFIKTDASANAVTIAGTINGAANHVLSSQWQKVKLRVNATGSGWLVVAS